MYLGLAGLLWLTLTVSPYFLTLLANVELRHWGGNLVLRQQIDMLPEVRGTNIPQLNKELAELLVTWNSTDLWGEEPDKCGSWFHIRSRANKHQYPKSSASWW